ncbi:hypothetical protein Vafri_2480 [Volvox africanus]|nr:hypothetical protein Vafri_2480 [Volvox africanus]
MWLKEIERRQKKKCYSPDGEGFRRLEEDFMLMGHNAVHYHSLALADKQRLREAAAGGQEAATAPRDEPSDELVERDHDNLRKEGELLLGRVAEVFAKCRQELQEEVAKTGNAYRSGR